MALGLFQIINVSPLGGAPSRYALTITSQANIGVGDHVGSRIAGDAGGIYRVDTVGSDTSIFVTDDLTEFRGVEFGLPAVGLTSFGTPEPNKNLTQLPFNSPGWDAMYRRNHRIMDSQAFGATGATGTAGADGMDGAAGGVGPMGLPGGDGMDGADGADGMDGAAGAVGAVGPAGPMGLPGDSAPLAEILSNGSTTSSGTFNNGGIVVSTGDSISGELDLLLRASQDLVIECDATTGGDITFTSRGSAPVPMMDTGNTTLSSGTSIFDAINIALSGGGGEDLAATLALGNTTAGVGLLMAAGDSVTFIDHASSGIRGVTNGAGQGARVNIFGGSSGGGFAGGSVLAQAGSSTAGGNGGIAQLVGGNAGGGVGNGGAAIVRGGIGNVAGGDGGNVELAAGRRTGGAGSGGAILLQTSATFGTPTTRWQVTENGHFLANGANLFDIGGATLADRPRTIYLNTSVVVGNTVTITTNSIAASAALSVTSPNDLNLSARGSSTPLNETGQEALSATDLSATSIIGAINELAGVTGGGGGEDLAATLTLGNTTGVGNSILLTAGTGLDTATATSLAIGITTATSVVVGRVNAHVLIPERLNVGQTARAIARGDFSAGSSVLESELFFDESLRRLSIIPVTATDPCFIQIGTAVVGGLLLSSDGSNSRATVKANNSVTTAGTHLTIESGNATGVGTAGTLTLDGGTSAGTNGAIEIGPVNASAVSIARPGITTTLGETVLGLGANAAQWGIQTSVVELVGLMGASVPATGVIPAKALVLGVTTFVTGAIGGATSYDVGDTAGDIDHWGAGITASSDPGDFTDNTLSWNNGTADDVVITANGPNFSSGSIRIVVTYVSITAPTS